MSGPAQVLGTVIATHEEKTICVVCCSAQALEFLPQSADLFPAFSQSLQSLAACFELRSCGVQWTASVKVLGLRLDGTGRLVS